MTVLMVTEFKSCTLFENWTVMLEHIRAEHYEPVCNCTEIMFERSFIGLDIKFRS